MKKRVSERAEFQKERSETTPMKKLEVELSDFSTDDHVSIGGPMSEEARKISKLQSKIAQIEQRDPELCFFKKRSESEEMTLDDAIDVLGGSNGRFQIMQAIAFALIFAVGSQFYHSSPFYLRKPALRCFDHKGFLIADKEYGEYCSRMMACDKEITSYYDIDYEHGHSINNWFTQLDLVCEERYKIGMLSTISYVSFAIGSVLFTNQIDRIGRRPVVLLFGMVTPLGILALQYLAFNLWTIQIIMFLMGLTYSSRSSVSFMYGGEFFRKDKRILMSYYTFTMTGMCYALSALWFWYTQDQRSYHWIMFLLTSAVLLFVYLFVPESPIFLYEMRRFSKLKQCFEQIATFNGLKNPQVAARYCKLQLKLAAFKQEQKQRMEKKAQLEDTDLACKNCPGHQSVFQNKVYRANLFAMCVLKSMGGFIFCLLISYSKYVPGNFYVNYSISGLSDVISMFYVGLISKRYHTVREQVAVLIWMLALCTLVMLFVTESGMFARSSQVWIIPMLLLLIRLNTGSIQNYGYHLNQVLFPVMMRGQSYGITNFVSRPIASVANIIVEVTQYPLLYVLGLSLLASQAISTIQEVDQSTSPKKAETTTSSRVAEDSTSNKQNKQKKE